MAGTPIGLNGPHCCEDMHGQVTFACEDGHLDPEDCPDAVVGFTPKYQEYGIWIHDGGTSWISIAYCPWCGTRLPESVRDQWFDALDRLGLDPDDDALPRPYEDERWLAPSTEG